MTIPPPQPPSGRVNRPPRPGVPRPRSSAVVAVKRGQWEVFHDDFRLEQSDLGTMNFRILGWNLGTMPKLIKISSPKFFPNSGIPLFLDILKGLKWQNRQWSHSLNELTKATLMLCSSFFFLWDVVWLFFFLRYLEWIWLVVHVQGDLKHLCQIFHHSNIYIHSPIYHTPFLTLQVANHLQHLGHGKKNAAKQPVASTVLFCLWKSQVLRLGWGLAGVDFQFEKMVMFNGIAVHNLKYGGYRGVPTNCNQVPARPWRERSCNWPKSACNCLGARFFGSRKFRQSMEQNVQRSERSELFWGDLNDQRVLSEDDVVGGSHRWSSDLGMCQPQGQPRTLLASSHVQKSNCHQIYPWQMSFMRNTWVHTLTFGKKTWKHGYWKWPSDRCFSRHIL